MTDVTPTIRSAAAEAVRCELRAREAFGRCSDLTDGQLDRLVEHVGGSLAIAVDTLALRPWPEWLMGVLYPGRTSAP